MGTPQGLTRVIYDEFEAGTRNRARAGGERVNLFQNITSRIVYVGLDKAQIGHSLSGNARVREAMLRQSIVCSAFLAAALFLSACSSASFTEADQQSMAAVATAPATLQPGDKIRVDVFGEDKLGGEYQLDQAGQVSVPLAGTVKAQGMTQTQLEQALAKKLRTEYLRNPKVTVTIATLAPFYIIGEVQKPGQFDYRSGLNVLTAMAVAGGPTYRASRNNVQIQRRGEAAMREYPISASVPVLPGDVIKVPERYF